MSSGRERSALGEPLADKFRDALREAGPKGISRTELRETVVGSNNVRAHKIEAALGLLLEHGLADQKHEATRGRPAEVWRTTEAWEQREQSGSPPDLPPKLPIAPIGGNEKNGSNRTEMSP